MKRLMTATAIAALTATAATAAVELETLDLNGDNFASAEEVMAWFPEMQFESFNNVDVNDDNRLDAEEIQTIEAQTLFGQFEMRPIEEVTAKIVLDADGDGFIMLDDYRRAYPDFTDLSFESIDANDDNRVSYVEHYALAAQTEIGRYETGSIRDIADIDTNADSFADFNEMTAAFPGLPMESFEDIDANDDNRISSEELYAPEAQQTLGSYM